MWIPPSTYLQRNNARNKTTVISARYTESKTLIRCENEKMCTCTLRQKRERYAKPAVESWKKSRWEKELPPPLHNGIHRKESTTRTKGRYKSTPRGEKRKGWFHISKHKSSVLRQKGEKLLPIHTTSSITSVRRAVCGGALVANTQSFLLLRPDKSAIAPYS